MTYDLVFVLLWEDVNLPLVFSQTFDQAEKQSKLPGALKPCSVCVWVLTPLRFFLGKRAQQELWNLRTRCPGVTIRLIPEINRLDNFPSRWFLMYYRRHLRSARIVFHFRGESTVHHFRIQYTKRNSDLFILDVRGYWPAELLYGRGVEDLLKIPSALKALYEQARNVLTDALQIADGVITVSENMSDLLRELCPSIGNVNVVPCSVRSIHERGTRASIRQSLGVTPEEKLLVYSGGYARYQHLEDLTIPFFNLLLTLNPEIKILILSQDLEKIQKIVSDVIGSSERFLFRKAEQAEVADYLSACDMGFLLRRESLVNRVAQPVKVGEYLAAGVPVCVEGEVGGVTEKLNLYQAGLSIHIADKMKDQWNEQAGCVLDFLEHDHAEQARSLARDYFTWDRNVLRQRDYYCSIFGR